jgi:multidrug efflux pump subunit AcrB
MENEGKSAEEAVFQACSLRFRPIVMTTIAAMMGAVPIAFGIGGTVAEGRAPLGIAVLGGLIFAQFVTLFVTPVTFVYVHKIHSYFTSRFDLFKEKEVKETNPPE